MHLLSVNADFRYDPIYAMGVVTAFERFMQGYKPERDKESIFNALCQSIGDQPQQYQQDAQSLGSLPGQMSSESMVNLLSGQVVLSDAGDFQERLQAIAKNSSFKYSRLFAVGLFTLLEMTSDELVKDEKQRAEAFEKICKGLSLSEDKLTKDLDLYRSNLDKMAQALSIMEDVVGAERKKREQQADEGGNAAIAPPTDNTSNTSDPDSPESSSSPTSSKDEAPSGSQQ